jgi:hypothetical protein
MVPDPDGLENVNFSSGDGGISLTIIMIYRVLLNRNLSMELAGAVFPVDVGEECVKDGTNSIRS